MAATAVGDGSAVKVFYRGTLDGGEEFDSNRGGEALPFRVGAGEVIAGFEEAVRGMRPGERKTFTLPPEQAYGERDEEMVVEIPRASMPEGEVAKGMAVRFKLPDDGEEVDGTIVSLDAERVLVDFNHPLAGKALTFEIEVVGVD
ncbi:MAG TPA: peptidylprolyl isomerase [Thermoplasmata archaeon]|nr:peptidylprolyl isomerase [Thermoplasmata archaeon]